MDLRNGLEAHSTGLGISCRDGGNVIDDTRISGVGIQVYIDASSQVKEEGEREGQRACEDDEFLPTDHSGSKHRSTETTSGAKDAQSPTAPQKAFHEQSLLCPPLAYRND